MIKPPVFRFVPWQLTPELIEINRKIINCPTCKAQSSTGNPPVSGYGYCNNKIMFIGQSPGPWGADQTSIPFTKDKSGVKFQELLKKLNLKFEDCYTTNLVKFCPGWGDLKPEWIEHSRDHLWEEIRAVNPRLIITFGRHAFTTLCPIGSLRHSHGKIASALTYTSNDNNVHYCDIFPFYHFAYYIRKQTWNEYDTDVTKLVKVLKKLRARLLDEQTRQTNLEAS